MDKLEGDLATMPVPAVPRPIGKGIYVTESRSAGRTADGCVASSSQLDNSTTETNQMETPRRLEPLLNQFNFARIRLMERMAGPTMNSGDDQAVPVPSMSDEEYLWEPVPSAWSIRRRSDGPASSALELVGAGDWGRDRSPDSPRPLPFPTIAWRLGHINEMLAIRADHMTGTHSLTRATYQFHGDAAGAIAAYVEAADAWRSVLTGADDAALDAVGLSTYPYGSDPDVPLIQTIWWMNQELLHHGAEIALLRDLYRATHG